MSLSLSEQNRLEIQIIFFLCFPLPPQIYGQVEDWQNNSLKYAVQMRGNWEVISFQIILKNSLLLSLFLLGCI